MNWFAILAAIFFPVVQPVIQRGVQHIQTHVQTGMTPHVQYSHPQLNPAPQPYIVYHEGYWWKWENNQWYVWR